ncbi:MAG: hypothetical protein F6K11_27760 [Leptolyngbya sp. SIO3F4]|nr:hypothetical protein [Leptolyngbya sp. SIO3F4]
MKNRLILFFILNVFLVFISKAQQRNTLIENNESVVERNMNLFGELGFKMMSVSGDAAPAFDAKIGLGVTEKISVGLGFQTSLSDLQPDDEINPNVLYNLYYGSIFLEYNWNPNSIFSISTPLQVGAGINKLVNESGGDIRGQKSDKIIAITPSVKGNLNISPKVSANVSVGYRVMGFISDARQLSNGDFSGIEGGIGLRFNIL